MMVFTNNFIAVFLSRLFLAFVTCFYLISLNQQNRFSEALSLFSGLLG